MNRSLVALKNIFENQNLTDYRSIPFWSWNNTLDEDELLCQIDDMKACGMGGFIMHARIGLKDEYMGEKWFSCIGACLRHAKKLGMNAWIYDENGWPSGFVGGKLLRNEEYLAQYLEYEVKSTYDPEAFAVFIKDETGYHRVTKETDSTEYHCIYCRKSPANTDILNPEVVSAFIEETHEQYYKRFPESFGHEMAGFFTDEPQYYRWGTPYSPYIREAYEKESGEDIRNGLIYLFIREAAGYAFRVRYYTIANRLYTENFYKRLYDWCEAHHCKLTGHSIEEGSPYGAMLGGAGVMPTYEYEHIPGIDCLGRTGNGSRPNTIMAIQAGSVASQLGIHQVLSETFACSGHDVTPKELKSIAEFQYFHGVNLMCQHLYPYSVSAQGKSDHPPVFSPVGGWFAQFKTFNEYFTRLGYLISNTEEAVDLLVISPQRSAYTDYLHGNYDGEMQDKFLDLIYNTLSKNGIRFHMGDESILARHANADGNTLTVGKCTYDTVLIPDMCNISSETVKLLKSYRGRLLLVGKPTLIDGVPGEIGLDSNTTLEEILASGDVKFRCTEGEVDIATRSGALGDYIFINNLRQDMPGKFVTEGVAEHYRALDLLSLKTHRIPSEMTLEPCESLILIRDEEAENKAVFWADEDITPRFAMTDIGENSLILDCGSISKDGEHFGETLPLQRIFEDLLREDYKGRLWVKQCFSMSEALPVKLLMEAGNRLSATLNGKPIAFRKSDFDLCFIESDISSAVRTGENELIYSVDYHQHDGVSFALFDPQATESLRNCLYYDTHIEPAYIMGDFVLDNAHTVCKKEAFPPMTSELCLHGYPFFKDTVTYQGAYTYDGHGARVLSLEGRFLVAEITVNGTRRDLILDTRADITDLLVIGKNEIEILLRASLRNFFGPHHLLGNPEPLGVSPMQFTHRGSWNGGMAPTYTPEYQCVPFGLDRIVMKNEDLLIRTKHMRNMVFADRQPAAMEAHVKQVKAKLSAYPKLAQMYENGYLHTARTVLDLREDGTYFVVSGDIPGMWMRDSATQVTHYTALAADPEIADLLEGVLRRQMHCIKTDPYANAFNCYPNGNGHITDRPLQNAWVFERKYEVDSLCYPMRLLYLYWKNSGRSEFVRKQLEPVARVILDTWRTEQHHMEKSPYRFIRENPPVPWDTIYNDGLGEPVAYTGMTWSGFRPSDDGCQYGYLTASEMFAVVVLGYMAEMLETVCKNVSMAEKCRMLAAEINEGIQKYCIIEHEKYGKIYACETDGMGHHLFFDDANIPSLLSIPYIGYAPAEDEIYQNTRRFLLSEDNPYYFTGTHASGIGSRHTPDGYIWHMAMVMQGLTSIDPEEKRRLVHLIATTDANTGYLHEGFDASNPANYTRDWFTWPNSLYAELIEQCIAEGLV